MPLFLGVVFDYTMNIHRFHSFEKQVEFFTARTGVHLPRMTFGKGAFFKDLGKWSSTYNSQAQDVECVHILPDPVQILSRIWCILFTPSRQAVHFPQDSSTVNSR